MANDVDGFVIPLPKKNLNTYRRLAQKAGRVWKDHGALEFREYLGDDLNVEMGTVVPGRNENEAGRDNSVFLYRVQVARSPYRVNAKVMKEPRMLKMMKSAPMPFDGKRMMYGGFKSIVEA